MSKVLPRLPGRRGRAARVAGLASVAAGHEHQHQVVVATWALLHQRKYPALECLFAIPNGGKRDVRVAAKLKLEGVKAGVLDLQLPVPMHGWAGLWVEMKHGKNDLTPAQRRWAAAMSEVGHLVAVCWSADWAIRIIEDYLEGKWKPTTSGSVGAIELSLSSLPGRALLMISAGLSPIAAPPTPAASSS